MERLYYKLGDQVDEKILRHLKRYDFCKRRIEPNSTVIDFGCGSGYGSKLLSFISGTKILSYDKSEEALSFFRNNNATPTISIETDKLNLKDANYVLMLDMIEHIEQSVLEKEMEELLANNPKALFFISTPLYAFNGQSPTNPYHNNCFTRQRFLEFLFKYFEEIEMWKVDWSYEILNNNAQFGTVITLCRGRKQQKN